MQLLKDVVFLKASLDSKLAKKSASVGEILRTQEAGYVIRDEMCSRTQGSGSRAAASVEQRVKAKGTLVGEATLLAKEAAADVARVYLEVSSDEHLKVRCLS